MTGKEICKNRYDKTKALKYVNSVVITLCLVIFTN